MVDGALVAALPLTVILAAGFAVFVNYLVGFERLGSRGLVLPLTFARYSLWWRPFSREEADYAQQHLLIMAAVSGDRGIIDPAVNTRLWEAVRMLRNEPPLDVRYAVPAKPWDELGLGEKAERKNSHKYMERIRRYWPDLYDRIHEERPNG